ncbi:DNA-formamidopyrimidine glycosylase family protein [Microbacterium sp. ASV81]|uniref:DNA-formamidopyrimidine glycosylase family protein n=1 Tax=Microbacterium capsulatum TaxID=3041921 RepID=A0ABU0XFS1_9MICO|nr:DNA-formamidopyrimidine glycosylase family protein [Microbacterium sp. ASV81]MDQ4213970.1 DNA-formamidopyrimidine glycosylase family protein [Microbacterium sp. ASV81]
MPESPEVQALVEFLDERVSGRVIAGVDGVDPRIVKTRGRPLTGLTGARMTAVRRYGKYVGFDTGAGCLVVSFGRNGWIRWQPSGGPFAETPAPLVARIALDDGDAMEIVETGDFLAVAAWVVDAPADVPGIAALGPDPISADFSREDLDAALGRRRKQIKALLQEQTSLAGIGNAYSDEILHRAKLSPTVHAAVLADDDRERLYTATAEILRGAVADRRGLPLDQLKAAKVAAMAVHGRGGEACPVCGTTIVDHVFGGASAQLCPACQGDEASSGA